MRNLVVYNFVQDAYSAPPDWLLSSFAVNAFEQRLNDAKYIHFLYLKNEAVAGYISIKKPNHLYHLFVDSRYQKQGISRQLWKHSVVDLRLTSCTVRSSIPAVPMYKKFGFEEFGPSEQKDGVLFQPMTWSTHER